MSALRLLLAGLAPVLGASTSLTNGIAIGLCALLLAGLHQVLMTPLRRHLDANTIPWANIVLIAALTTCLLLALRAWALPLAEQLGHYPALLALTCLAIDPLLPQRKRWRALGLGLAGLLVGSVSLGLCRQLLSNPLGMHLAEFAPGALIILGLLLGLYNHLRPRPPSSRRQGTR
ncbi:Rnf-Nqr domain containing protein [Pseudomonas xantholysinigenes]|uniref:NADH:quinone oxidoreductase n=1 Tax=Pseudomonas xantholysinigenes TaxID=2745490 RepID=A0A9E6PYJ0_9PSED|nr:Rnf-Nqr domain containing protein [Pseudomonas xantholysinigenes]QXI39583.1 NADH:quinone oxidoreductase [Pseudomonas xantholysinigenes]